MNHEDNRKYTGLATEHIDDQTSKETRNKEERDQ